MILQSLKQRERTGRGWPGGFLLLPFLALCWPAAVRAGITGTTVDSLTGTPLATVRVELRPGGVTAFTNGSGHFSLVTGEIVSRSFAPVYDPACYGCHWFDLQGRVVRRPERTGVYVVRDHVTDEPRTAVRAGSRLFLSGVPEQAVSVPLPKGAPLTGDTLVITRKGYRPRTVVLTVADTFLTVGLVPAQVFDPADEYPMEIGKLKIFPAYTIYPIVTKPRARGRVALFNYNTSALMLRVYNPAEELVHWQYLEGNLDSSMYYPRDRLPDGSPELPVTYPTDSYKTMLDGSFSLLDTGVHQIRLSGNGADPRAYVALSDSFDYGISMQNGYWRSWGNQPDTMYFYIPARARELKVHISSGTVTVLDAGGNEELNTSTPGLYTISLSGSIGQVWKWVLHGTNYQYRAYGIPVILCNTPAAARRIKCSQIILPDSTIVAHKFQKEVAAMLPKLLHPDLIGNTEDLVEPLNLAGWLTDPVKNVRMTNYDGSLSRLPFGLRQQNLDPASRWGGAFISVTHPDTGYDRNHPWPAYSTVPGLGGDPFSHDHNTAYALAKWAVTDDPINPYYGKMELLYRAAASNFLDLLHINEAEVFHENESDPYPGGLNFSLAMRSTAAYRYAAPLLPDSIAGLWYRGLRRLMDRAYVNYVVSSMNQSAHCLTTNEQFAIGSGDSVFTRLSRMYAQRFEEAQSPAGYFRENNGPDASYTGMTNFYMAKYYHMSGDEQFLDAIQRCLYFFNHTTVPEPGGNRVLSSFNFGHRVAWGYMERQYGGERDQLDALLPEAAVWYNIEYAQALPVTVPEAEDMIRNFVAVGNRDAWPGHLSDTRWDHFSPEVDTGGVLPAREEGDFTREFGDEFLAVKRNGYYVLIYYGSSAPNYSLATQDRYRPVFPDSSEFNGYVVGKHIDIGNSSYRPVPYSGGGISLLWNPAYGTSVMGTNWSPLCHNGIIAMTTDSLRYWEDYHSGEPDLSPDQQRLTVTGTVEDQPLDYARTYRFGDDTLFVDLVITAADSVELLQIFESIPLADGNRKSHGTAIRLDSGGDRGITGGFTISDSTGHGTRFIFDDSHTMSVFRNGIQSNLYGVQYQVDRVEVALPTVWATGDTARLTYKITGY